MLELKNIGFITTDENIIIENVNYNFEKGKSYAILGNNGVGKSTLAKIIMGLENYYKNHKGKIFFLGEDITEKKVDERARMGLTLAWQEPARFINMTVTDYITLGGKVKLTNEEIKNYLSIVGLDERYIKRNVDKTLSGGERKRIELASIMALKPKLVIFDEPDSGIDMMSNQMIANIFEELKNSEATVLTITHREEIALLADEALLLCNGTIYKQGSPEFIGKIYKQLCDVCNHINSPKENMEVE
jgi:Fe-S cluster assembly ATP-binding protein